MNRIESASTDSRWMVRAFAGNRRGVPALLLGLLLLCLSASAIAQTYPLRIASSGRYLEDQTGTPYLVNADAAWSLTTQLTYAQANTYLTDRAGRGFNGLLVNLIEHHFCDHAPANIYSVSPWTGAVFATPNEPYFALVDSMISRAQALGLCVFLDPIYLGSDASQGWQNEASAASYATMKAWGAYVGNRYKNYPNIIWVMGADMDPTTVTGLRSKVDSMVAGMKSADTVYPSRLYTTHSERGTQAWTHWPESWVTLNNIYTHETNLVTFADAAYSHSPTMPFFLIEGDYEGEGPTPQEVRAQAYWTIFRGGSGHIFGNCPIWAMGTTVYTFCGSGFSVVQAALNSTGSQSMTHFRDLLVSRHWSLLKPDLTGSVLTAGASSGTSLGTVAYASDSSVILGYVPTQRSVTIDPSVLSGDSIHVQWYNPANGVYTEVGRYLKGSRSYSPTSSGDWVLVIDTIAGTPVTPSAPTLLQPINGATNVPLAPTLSWNASSGATSYHVQVSTDSAFGTTAVDQSGIASTSLPISGLASSTVYYWHVNASNSAGTSLYSATWSFTTVPPAPASPTLSSPSNLATSIAVAPTLTWNASSGATSYRVQVSTSASFTSTVVDQSSIAGTSQAISGLANNTQYYWHVSATNTGGTSSYSTAWSFTTIVAAPSSPAMSSPSNGASSIAVAPTLTWNTSSGATSYRVQVSSSPSFSSTLVDSSSISATSLAISGLANNTQYYWRVNATNAGGTSSWASAWSFTTIVAAPSSPALSSPSNGSSSIAVAPTLAWNTSSGATSYRVQVSTSPSFSSTLVDSSSISATSLVISGLANNTQYYWRANATNAGGTSSWASAWNFTTIVAAPATPVLVSPSNGATGLALNPNLTWNSAAGATSYHVQVSKSPSFGTTAIDQSGVTDTLLNAPGLETGTIYYWHVAATNPGGTSSYSAPWSFAEAIVTDVNDPNGSGLPRSFALEQNYPNPFNPGTTIRFAVPEKSFVKLGIYDVLGRPVAILVNGVEKAGYGSVQFDGRELPSGVYFCRMEAGDFVQTRKLLLLK